MKHDELMRRLTDARPGHLDPDRPVDPEVRRTELEGIMARTGELQAAPGKRGRSRIGVRSAWSVALAGVAVVAAAALVVTVAGPPGGGPRPEAGAPATDFSESRLLLAAAAAVEKTEATSGAYWYREVRMASLHRVPGKDYKIYVRHETKSWLTKGTGKRDRRWTLFIDAGARPATPADEKAWRADGSPKRWDLTDYSQAARRALQHEWERNRHDDGPPPELQPEIVTWDGEGEVEGDAPGGISDGGPGGAEIGLAELESLPTDPERLRERLEQIVEEQYNGPPHIQQMLLGQTAENLAVELPTSPQLRAAAYRVRASLPGVRDIGEVTDRSGRPGYAVELKNPRPGGEGKRRLIFDRETGLPLSAESYATSADDGHRAGELAGYTTYTAMRWTDQAPPFDKDFMADER
ncbi:CU044_5270 family protein [Streptomyces sp. NPDC050388]|uniref:CU044_5270 family protein n=1 Tax=Streptomyces sp. NPDC050388 TaxID=3155781 RepID=UPI00341474FC